MDIRWVTVFVDRPANGFDEVQEFWRRVTGTTMSAPRGAHDEFATFVPPDGDAFFKVQRVQDGPGGCHLDLHVEDPRAVADRALGLGATELADLGTVVVLRSPAGVVFCTVPVRVDGERPSPVGPAGARTLIDQVSIDVAPEQFDGECEFWVALTGWPEAQHDRGSRTLARPAGQPLRFVLRRWGDDRTGDTAECHLDLACDDVAAAVREHVALGAEVEAERDGWTVMRDPGGHAYCLTVRDPDGARIGR